MKVDFTQKKENEGIPEWIGILNRLVKEADEERRVNDQKS